MRSIQLALCAGVAAAAVIVPAAAAHADNETEGQVTVTPSTIAPGGEVDLRISVCRGKQATGTSDAFSSPAYFNPAADGGLFAQAHIRSDAKPKDYEIWVKCRDGRGQASGTITVIRHHNPTHHPTPTAPVHAGGGGTAEMAAAEAEEDGPGTPHTVIGLVLAGVAAVAVAYRSVRRRRTDSD